MGKKKNIRDVEQAKPVKPKADFRTKMIAGAFILLILLLVTLLMPRSGTIGICLQALAGLIFIIDQIKTKIIQREDLLELKNKINDSSFQDKLPIIAIPLLSPVILVMYFKYGTNTVWYQAFFSILMAVSVSSYAYLFFITTIAKFLKRFYNYRNSFLRHSSYRPYLWANLSTMCITAIALFAEILAIYPLFQLLKGNTILAAFPTAAYFTLFLFTAYGFLLSLMYFLFYGFLKLLLFLTGIHISKNESDKMFTRRLIWIFLFIFWTWGSVLLIINSL